jgi:acylphosphatase
MADLEALDLVVHGRVQGVFFRAHVRAEAARRGVAGRAVNRDDGTVAVHIEGPREAVAAVAAACRTGPERSRVDLVEESVGHVEGLAGFATG